MKILISSQLFRLLICIVSAAQQGFPYKGTNLKLKIVNWHSAYCCCFRVNGELQLLVLPAACNKYFVHLLRYWTCRETWLDDGLGNWCKKHSFVMKVMRAVLSAQENQMGFFPFHFRKFNQIMKVTLRHDKLWIKNNKFMG